MFWIFLIFGLSCFFFKRSLYKLTKTECTDIGHAAIQLKDGEINVYRVDNDSLKKVFFTILSGFARRYKNNIIPGAVAYNQKNLLQEKTTGSFLYLCKPGDIPGDILALDLVNLAISKSMFSKEEAQAFLSKPELQGITGKRFKELSKEQKLNVVLAFTIAIKRDITLVHDVAPKKPANCQVKLKIQLDVLIKESLVIYLNSLPIQLFLDIDDESVYQHDDGIWVSTVEALRSKINMKAKNNTPKTGGM